MSHVLAEVLRAGFVSEGRVAQTDRRGRLAGHRAARASVLRAAGPDGSHRGAARVRLPGRMRDRLRSARRAVAAARLRARARAAAASPPSIAKETQALASRMGPQGAEPALRQFAKEISDPVGDHVAVALIVRHRHGGVGLADVLAQLAGDVDEQVRMRRDILAEQSKQISNLRGILAVTVGAWVLLTLFARTYMAPYSQPSGQLALGVIVAGFGLTLGWFSRLARPVLGARFLEDLPRAAELPDNEQPWLRTTCGVPYDRRGAGVSPLYLIVLGGMLILAGAGLAVRAVRPAPPRLSAVMAQLNAQPARRFSGPTEAPARQRSWLPAAAVAFAERHWAPGRRTWPFWAGLAPSWP